MKKILMLGTLLLMLGLLVSTTYSYWQDISIKNNIDTASDISLKIGTFTLPSIHPIGATDFQENTHYIQNNVVYYKDMYLLRYRTGWHDKLPDSPDISEGYSGHYRFYSNQHFIQARYFIGDLVIMNEIVYRADNGGASNMTPEQSDGWNGWKKMGHISDLKWQKTRTYAKGSVTYHDQKLYVANETIQPNQHPEPGIDFGWNLQNTLQYDPFTIYKKSDEAPTIVAAYDSNSEHRLYLLKSASNYKNGIYTRPGQDAAVWLPYPFN
ncbi:hypothetical protein [Erysipelothrix aquatica]|uniref:hypothetical protein n=1 Tax=Erysipelothrix aquatica TaxID=2683714 RepID=UPI0013591EA7|nr:hypothetical protein [Erysipelothrix aquatica]